jgi:hypothetical protein
VLVGDDERVTVSAVARTELTLVGGRPEIVRRLDDDGRCTGMLPMAPSPAWLYESAAAHRGVRPRECGVRRNADVC